MDCTTSKIDSVEQNVMHMPTFIQAFSHLFRFGLQKKNEIKYPVLSSGTVSREHFCKPQICTNVFVSKG